MAVINIDGLPDVDMMTLDGTELFELLQGGVNKKMDLITWYSILSGGGGGLPSGDPYQVLMMEADGVTPAYGNIFLDMAGGSSIDIFNRIISRSSGVTIMDYEQGYIYNEYGSIVFDIRNEIIGDITGITSLDANNRYLCNQYGLGILNYQNFYIDTNAIAGNAGYSPSISYTLNAGAGASVSHPSGSNNLSGKITLNTGTGVGTGAYVNFSNNGAFPNNTFVTLTPANQLTAALYGNQQVCVIGNNAFWSILSGSAPLADSSTYEWYYHVIGG